MNSFMSITNIIVKTMRLYSFIIVTALNPVVDGACYALPEIFDKVDVFESDLPFSWVYDENGITKQ